LLRRLRGGQQAPIEALPPPTKTERWRSVVQPWSWALRYIGLAALFLVIYWLVLRPVKKQFLTLLRELPARIANKNAISETAGGQIAAAPHSEALEDILGAMDQEGDVSLKKLAVLKNHLVEKVKTEPASASRLVQNWLQEGSAE